MSEYLVSHLQRPGGRGGDKTHIGAVDYWYGPEPRAWVRTLCGLWGRMMGKPNKTLTFARRPECGNCARSQDRRLMEEAP